MVFHQYSELAALMTPKMETSARVEEALSQLAGGLNPNKPQCDGRSSNPLTTETGLSTSWISTNAVLPVTLGIGQEFSALRFYQCVSAYHR
jgi:hypothetical protein